MVRAQRCLVAGGRVGWGMWDVRGGFGNSRLEVVKQRMISKCPKLWEQWGTYIEAFFRARVFEVEWDSKFRGTGKTNVGVPQGSPLSPVIFLIFMAPILEDMEEAITAAIRRYGRTTQTLDIGLPSYGDDIFAGILDASGTIDVEAVPTE